MASTATSHSISCSPDRERFLEISGVSNHLFSARSSSSSLRIIYRTTTKPRLHHHHYKKRRQVLAAAPEQVREPVLREGQRSGRGHHQRGRQHQLVPQVRAGDVAQLKAVASPLFPAGDPRLCVCQLRVFLWLSFDFSVYGVCF